MTVNGETHPDYSAGTGPDDFAVADDPPGDMLTDDETAGSDFADGEAPYGWTRDRKTGKLRPKTRPGRPKVPPGPEELAAAPPVEREPDKPPAARRAGAPRTPGATPVQPMPRGGVIAAGV